MKTHEDLSGYAADHSVLGKDNQNHLKYLGFAKGLQERLRLGRSKQTVKDWIKEGAELEDDGIKVTGRFRNHFHHPLKDWDEAGLNDLIFTGQSALLWAQDSHAQTSAPSGDQSWETLRFFFLNALTAADPMTRERNYAKTFRGLGHQIHLLQDAAQPDHVRNDAHIHDGTTGERPRRPEWGLLFETWAGHDNQKSLIESFAAHADFPQVYLNLSIPDELVPISQFLDTNTYNGSFPSSRLTQGIAEYTNANFFSDDTIFSADERPPEHRHYFPYPNIASTNLQDYTDGHLLPKTTTAEDRVEDISFWISKTGDGDYIEHFVKPTYLSKGSIR
ncbi:MAG: hypothetical protein ETSY2_17910 [Candidatus Entotheonella gemina]|uniref:Uncharacterized protein n=1 Tax=Candidatus Entotheonella gemina TaxID=1429439 RepID=W4M819_9BACT|nr:MAG: hypothetical protein ETSY2_17910 [Candidatus Entotheonella gemina]